MPFVTVEGRRLEYELIAARDADAPTLILLHEGLGSLAQWRDFPERLAQATGCATLVYSRLGYGQSDALTEARRVDYMHVEALETLPALRDALAIADPILVGHSDGASIALIHAGARRWPVRGLILEAPICAPASGATTATSTAPSAAGTTSGSLPNSAPGTSRITCPRLRVLASLSRARTTNTARRHSSTPSQRRLPDRSRPCCSPIASIRRIATNPTPRWRR
jgi:pimeloyl-ACP methyl ester carboxylesterase